MVAGGGIFFRSCTDYCKTAEIRDQERLPDLCYLRSSSSRIMDPKGVGKAEERDHRSFRISWFNSPSILPPFASFTLQKHAR